jgi:hypothetical protein
MNRNRDRDARLLAETFHADWATGHASVFARAAAANARHRRTLRHTLGATVAAIAIGAFTFLATRHSTLPPVQPIAEKSAVTSRGYEIISDDELLAQLHDRPLLVVKKENGEKEFLLLPSAEETPESD